MKQMEETEQNIKSGYKEIKDLTEKVKEKIKVRPDFPKEVEIKEVKLLLNPYDKYYVVSIKYGIDRVEYEDKRTIYTNLEGTRLVVYSVMRILSDIEHFYQRTHKFE